MRKFTCNELDGALAYAAAGGQALHLHRIVFPDSPLCFRMAVKRGEDIDHLFDLDEVRLIATSRLLRVRVIFVDRPGTTRQHIDLCAGPMRKALSLCEEEACEP